MTGETEVRRQSHSELEELRRENRALRRQISQLREQLIAQAEVHRNANKAKDALITRLQFELSDIERDAGDSQSRIAQLLEENERLRNAIVDAASS